MYQGKATKGSRKGNGSHRKGKGKMIMAVLLCAVLFAIGKGNQQGKIIGYTYDSGNTVWEMAQRHCPNSMDIRKLAREIEQINGIEDHIVYANVTYKIPIYKERR